MRFIIWAFLLLGILACNPSRKTVDNQPKIETKEPLKSLATSDLYDKMEYHIPMRDGIKLYTAVYTPKSRSASNTYPIMLKRTPYSCRPYGPDNFPELVGASPAMMADKYIFVYQDVRGRWNSEGDYDNMRPQIPIKKHASEIDESSDTYDTIDWLLKNIEHHNGRVGQWGISYPGFYTTAGALCGHPALKASSPQAPIADFYFDDFHHQGAYLLSYFRATTVFGYQSEPTTEPWYEAINPGTPDQYEFFLDMGPLSNGDKYYGKDNFFWRQLKEHPNYDNFWKRRNILPHLVNIDHAILTVGGWFDAEDLYGPLMTYKTIEKNNPGIKNSIVMGPWSHGDWARDRKDQYVSYINFGTNLSKYFQEKVELPFFKHHLKDGPDPNLPEALLYDTGKKKWQRFEEWPLKNAEQAKLYFGQDERLTFEQKINTREADYVEFISDPDKPVPYTSETRMVFTPRKFMADDQRFASQRPDVLVFETGVLKEDITMGGELLAKLNVSTTGTDADWVVKIIDVYPGDFPDDPRNPENIKLGGYQQLVRSECIRGRFRNDFSKPEPFVPNEITAIDLKIQDVLHTFKKGHRIMIQVQSTWFPYIDRNPQKYVKNIFKAKEKDFQKATHRVYLSEEKPSYLEVELLK